MKPRTETLPPDVKRNLKRVIEDLSDARSYISENRLIGPHHGELAAQEKAPVIDRLEARLTEFRANAKKHGINPEPIIAELGGTPLRSDDKRQDVITAAALGTAAFHAGKMCVPAHDRKLNELLKGNQVGEGLPVLDAWLRGWTVANLAAPIPDLPEPMPLPQPAVKLQTSSRSR